MPAVFLPQSGYSGPFGISFFEVRVKKRSIRTVGSGLMCIGLAVGVMVLQSGNAEAQVARPLPGAGSTFLTNVSWQPVESTMMFGPQQDHSMPAYQAPAGKAASGHAKLVCAACSVESFQHFG